jgi:hypothetical protein
MPWGLGPWGLGPWGSGTTPPAYITGAVISTVRSMDVYFSAAMLAVSPLGEHDALNPARWSVQRYELGTTNVEQEFIVLEIIDLGGGSMFRVTILGVLGEYPFEHAIDAFDLYDALGNPALSTGSSPLVFVAPGLAAAAQNAAARQDVVWDLRNDPFSLGDTGSIGGVFQTTSGADYDVQSGAELLRKLIIRRLTTMPGAFIMLRPGYGDGIALKVPLRAFDLPTLRARILQGVLSEPEVADAKVMLSMSADGILAISIQAKIRTTGAVVPVNFEAAP